MPARAEPSPSATRPTWAEVSLSALRQNFAAIRKKVGPAVEVCAVVKADAYGHGATACARALEIAGARWFGVTTTEEGVLLRQAGIAARILLMTGFWRGQEADVVRHGLTPVIWLPEHIERLQQAVTRAGGAEHAATRAAGGRLPVHLKLDTGMGRLGADMATLPTLARQLLAARNLEVEGFCTHLASAEVTDAPDVAAQQPHFSEACEALAMHGIEPTLRHMANSAAIFTRPQTHLSMVRPGISLYGYCLPLRSASGEAAAPPPLVPVLAWKTRIVSLRSFPAGAPLGYNGAWVTPGPARIAVLPVGYADGLSRKLSSRGRVLVRGQAANIVGNISMDITLADVTAIPAAEIGDEVTLIGAQGAERITADEHAQLAGTISYEVLCAVSKRVPRTYLE